MKLVEKIKKLEADQKQLAERHDYYKRKIKRLSMMFDVLNAKARKHIKPSNFALPNKKKYPIHDIAHARNALARSSGKPEEAQVKSAVYRKYPELNKKKK